MKEGQLRTIYYSEFCQDCGVKLDTLELKDWVKLKLRNDLGKRVVLVADYEVTLQPEAEFKEWIGEKLFECMDSSSR